MRSLFRVIVPVAAIAGILGAAAIAPADAWEKGRGVSAGHAQTIDLGYVHGTAYYTPAEDGFRVVDTLSVAQGAPLRFSATLQPEQAVSISVPGAEGAPARTVEIVRRGDAIAFSEPERLVLN